MSSFKELVDVVSSEQKRKNHFFQNFSVNITNEKTFSASYRDGPKGNQ
jgi:hypothetical protein